jgi:hypothetical protein
MAPSGKGGVPTSAPTGIVPTLGHTDPPPPPAALTLSATAPLRMWLGLMGTFLLASSLTFVSQPAEQVDALMSHVRPERRRGLGCGLFDGESATLPWCSRSAPLNVDAEFAVHLVRSLGATYGALGALSLALTFAPLTQQVLAVLVLALWSLASISSQPDFLPADDVRRRARFHCVVLCVDLLCVAWALRPTDEDDESPRRSRTPSSPQPQAMSRPDEAKELAAVSFFLKRSGITNQKFELQPVTPALRERLAAFERTALQPLLDAGSLAASPPLAAIRNLLLEHEPYFAEIGAEIGAEMGASASRARESRANLDGFIEHLHARKKAIKAAKRDQQFDLWEAEYADAKASDWAALIGPASMRT